MAGNATLAWAGFGVMVMAAITLLIFIFRQLQRAPAARPPAQRPRPDKAVFVIWAGEDDSAKRLATQTVQSLRASDVAARLVAVTDLSDRAFHFASALLFVISARYDGQSTEDAEQFLDRELPSVGGLPYAVMSLSDSLPASAQDYGTRLDRRLRLLGAVPLIDSIEAVKGDSAAIRRWQQILPLVGGSRDEADWAAPNYAPWRLIYRERINSGSGGSPVFHIRLEPEEELPHWDAGAIVEIYPGPAEQAIDAITTPLLPHRQYSIASLPADGGIEIVVRERHASTGALGLGSSWLCDAAQPGQRIALRLRENPGFAAPPDDIPMILIGNGSGIAGLRAHIKARPAGSRNWLIFGERNSAYDCLMGSEIADWVATGHLERCDLIFSRDGPVRRYVCHHIAEYEGPFLDWVLAGAAIYVCGNLHGMAADVDTELSNILGRDVLDAMIADGRYRRDVY